MVNPDCSVTCQLVRLPFCGDGKIDKGEECDDGNTRDGDQCTALCKFNRGECGDGIVQSALGEQCDDGNDINDDDCDNSCKWTPIEECIGAGCLPNQPFCGDGILQPDTEQCDFGDANTDDANGECRTNCVLQYCGDGIWDSFIEECDDGNNLNGDDCSAVCTKPSLAAPPPPPVYYPPTIPTPAKTPTGPGLVIFLASGAAAGVGLVRRRFLDRK